MKFINKNLLFKGAVALTLIAGSSYHVYTIGNLEEELQETNKTLERQQIDSKTQVEKKIEELNKLEKDHRDAEEKLKGKDLELKEKDKALEESKKDIENKKKEIENLKSELQAKLDTENNLANVQTVENNDNENESVEDKSTVLSKEKEVKTEQSEEKESKNNQSNAQNTNIGTFNVTYYSAYDGTQIGITADGTDMSNGNIYTVDGYRVVAVDPNVIPLGTILEITTNNGESFKAKASDTGGAIQGNKIDIAVSNPDQAYSLGTGTAEVKIVK